MASVRAARRWNPQMLSDVEDSDGARPDAGKRADEGGRDKPQTGPAHQVRTGKKAG
jgi:hypothetical protein